MDSLLKNLERSGDTGVGVDLLRRKARERGRNLEREEREKDPEERSRSKPKVTKSDDPEYKAFIAERELQFLQERMRMLESRLPERI